MASYDLVIENSSLMTPTGLIEANLGITEGKIAMISTDRITGGKRLNLKGKVVLPGVVDLHSHIRDPGYTYKEDFESGSKAAAAGGVTTFVDMPNVEPPTSTLETFEQKKRIASRKSVVDFNHFVFPTVEEVPKMAKAGAAGFKIFQIRGAYPHDPRICVEDHAKLYEMFRAVARTGRLCLVHPSNMSLFELYYQIHKKKAPKDPDYINFGRAYVEELIYGTSVNTLIMLAKETGVRLHLVHTHSAMAIEAIRQARREGYDISAQVDPKYFVTTEEELKRMGALVLPGGLIKGKRLQTIWDALREGTIDTVGTDHAPHTREEVVEKMAKNPWDAPFGCPQLQHYLSVFLNEVNKGNLTLEQLVRLSATAPAKLINVYPRKGTIQVGSDADLVAVDMKKEETITEKKRTYSKVGWTPYEGRRVKGIPVMTIRRGEIIMEDGDVTGKPGSGKFIRPLAH